MNMNMESKMIEHSGIHDFKVNLDISVDFFLDKNPQYLVTLTKHGVLVKPYYGKEESQ